MSFKSKFNKYARKIATALTYFDNEGLGKNPLLDISRLLKNSRPVIFDVGANVGQSIIKYKKQIPKSFIYSFEPSPETYKTLIRTANQYESVKAINCALGSIPGKTILYENSYSDMYKKSAKFSEIYDFLIGNGFILVSLYQFHYQKGVAGWTDGLFVHSSLVHE